MARSRVFKEVLQPLFGEGGVERHVGRAGAGYGDGRAGFLPAAGADDGAEAPLTDAGLQELLCESLCRAAELTVGKDAVFLEDGRGVRGAFQCFGEEPVQGGRSGNSGRNRRGVGEYPAFLLFLGEERQPRVVPEASASSQHFQEAAVGAEHVIHESGGEELIHAVPVEVKAVIHLADLMVNPDLGRLRDGVHHGAEGGESGMGAVLIAEAKRAREDDGDDVGSGMPGTAAPFAGRVNAGVEAVIHVRPEPLLQGFGALHEGQIAVESAVEQDDGREVADNLRYVRMHRQPVKHGHVDSKAAAAAPAGEHFHVAGEEQAGWRNPSFLGELPERGPGILPETGGVTHEVRLLNLRGRDGQGKIRSRGEVTDPGEPVLHVFSVRGKLPDFFLGQHVIPERESRRVGIRAFGVAVGRGKTAHHQIHAVEISHEQVEAHMHAPAPVWHL